MANYDYAILIAGNGDTTRANVEALLEDYILSKDGKGVLVLAFESKPSAAQIWAGQLATQHSLEAIIVSPPNGLLDSVPKGSFVEAPAGNAASIGASVAQSSAADPVAFIVWSDEDPECANLLAECQTRKIFAFDLTNGLCSLIPSPKIEKLTLPDIPVAEMIEAPVVNLVTGELLQEIPEDEEAEDEEDDNATIIFTAIYAFAELVADMVAERIKGDS